MKFLWAIYSLLSALCGGVNAVVCKRCVRNVDTVFLTALRTVVVLVIAAVVVGINGMWNQLFNVESKSLLFLLVSGVLTALAWFCYFRAMKNGSAHVVAAIDKFSVVLTMIGGWLLLGEFMSIAKWFSLAMITVGILLMLTFKSNKIDNLNNAYRSRQKNTSWIVWSALSVILVSISTLFSKVGVASVDSRLSLLIRTIAVLLVSGIAVLWKKLRRDCGCVPFASLPMIVLSGILTGVGWIFFFRALELGDAGLVQPVDKLSVFVTAILSVVCFREPLNFRASVGLLVLSLGISLLIIL